MGAPVSADEQNQPEIQPKPDQDFTCSWCQHAMVTSFFFFKKKQVCFLSGNKFQFCFPIRSIGLVKPEKKNVINVLI